MTENEYTKREKTGEVRFIYKTFICLETKNSKKEKIQGWVINKKKASNVDAEKIIWIFCNIIDLLMVITFEQKD